MRQKEHHWSSVRFHGMHDSEMRVAHLIIIIIIIITTTIFIVLSS